MSRKLGITLPHLGGSQIGLEVLEAVQAHYSENWTTDVSLFYEEPLLEAFNFPCACFPLLDVHSYDGPVVATTVNAAAQLLDSVTVPKKWFYIFDLEWVASPREFNEYRKIYRNPKLKLVARSKNYARYVENAFNLNYSVPVLSKFSVEYFFVKS